MREIEEIKSLYHQVEHKTRFIASAAKEFEKSRCTKIQFEIQSQQVC